MKKTDLLVATNSGKAKRLYGLLYPAGGVPVLKFSNVWIDGDREGLGVSCI